MYVNLMTSTLAHYILKLWHHSRITCDPWMWHFILYGSMVCVCMSLPWNKVCCWEIRYFFLHDTCKYTWFNVEKLWSHSVRKSGVFISGRRSKVLWIEWVCQNVPQISPALPIHTASETPDRGTQAMQIIHDLIYPYKSSKTKSLTRDHLLFSL